MKKRFSIFLALILLLAFFAIPAQAAQEAEGYLPLEEAAKAAREHMENRDTLFTLQLRSEETDADVALEELLHQAFYHTGKPTQGDYLRQHVDGYTIVTSVTEKREEQLYTFVIDMDYTTTAEQEAELNHRFNQIMASLTLEGKTEVEKVRAIYDYIAENVVYEYDSELFDEEYLLQFSVYSALMNGTTTDNGFAALFYRMANAAGLDSRVIQGYAWGGFHTWNIVKIGELYYSLDVTWDAGETEYAYFLKGTENFTDHAPDIEYCLEAFLSDYPAAGADYASVCEHHYRNRVVEPNCTDFGYTISECACGSELRENWVDPLGHSYNTQDICTVCGSVGAFNGVCGENVTWRLDEEGTLTISGTGSMTDYGGLAGKPPYQDTFTTIYKVVVEEGVTHIGDRAFDDSLYLTDVVLPEGMESIGEFAFSDSGLEWIVLPESLRTIGEFAFYGCENLLSIAIPDGVATIGDNAFSDCNNMTDVVIPASVTSFGESVFSSSGVQRVIFEKGVTSIGKTAFTCCYDLTDVVIPNTVTTIGEGAFSQCESLVSIIIPSGVQTIGDNAFAHCYSLESIVIPKSVTAIGERAFYNCWNIMEIHFKGDAPEFARDSFKNVLATTYYPLGNKTWIDDMIQGIGGLTIWLPESPICYHLSTQEIFVKDATCLEQGYSGDSICAGCGEITKVGEATPISDHHYLSGWCIDCDAADPDWTEPVPEKDVDRLAGAHRYETAFLAADQMKENLYLEKFDTVVVASGQDFADALSGSYLAAVNQAPILLACDVEWINDLTKDYIRENLNPGGTVYILGGTKAIPESFQEGLESFNIDRLAGNNRFDTNLLVLAEAGVEDQDILVCTGVGFADSLSASATQMPILLVYKDELLDGQTAFLRSVRGQNLHIIGGEGAVSQKLETQLADYGTVERVAGGNRFETSVKIAERFFGYTENAVLAYAWDFPDGLCGGPLAVSINAPLILTMDKYEQQAASYIQSNAICNGLVLGGEKLISDNAVRKIFDMSEDMAIPKT